jgi:hypothetical protein
LSDQDVVPHFVRPLVAVVADAGPLKRNLEDFLGHRALS